jgi:hypothetical protein
MAGHLGAAVIAGYFFGEDQPRLADTVYSAIEKELNRIIGGEESLWFDPHKAGITMPELFAPFPEEQAQESGIRSIADALTRNIAELHESGHNAIFAAIALRALHDHKMYATPSITSGIRKLIGQFDAGGPGRGYYGKQRGWITGNQVALARADEFPPYKDQHAMAEAAIGAGRRRRGQETFAERGACGASGDAYPTDSTINTSWIREVSMRIELPSRTTFVAGSAARALATGWPTRTWAT